MAGLVFIFGFWTLAGACQRHGAGGFVVLFTIIIFSLSHIRRLTYHSLHRAPLVGRPDFFLMLAGACQFGTARADLRLIAHPRSDVRGA